MQTKVKELRSCVHGEALVASMFSFSARFCPGDDSAINRRMNCPTPSYFADIASNRLDLALRACDDAVPPLCLLQASVLESFYHLTQSVRSKSWRILGKCIRLAYDMNLHSLDAIPEQNVTTDSQDIDVRRWSLREEKRRSWWAIWEMDMFSSTIRNLPLAIDWKQNFTFLPVSDTCWFSDMYQPSCYLAEDPSLRWKLMSDTGSKSPKAWFILVNSLVHDAHVLVYNPWAAKGLTSESKSQKLTIISNCLYCIATSLPTELAYHGQNLNFKTKSSPHDTNTHQFHSDIYAICLMTQLAQFMIYHHKVCAEAPWLAKHRQNECDSEGGPKTLDQASWSNYMKITDDIITLVRNSSYDHHKFVNPFLANTLWFAAAAQIACLVFGPSSHSKELLESNFELLSLAIDHFIAFWCSMAMLKPRLARVEAALRNLMGKEAQGNGDGQAENIECDVYHGFASDFGNMRTEASTQLEISGTSEPKPSETNLSGVDPAALSFQPSLLDIDDPSTLTQHLNFYDLERFLPYSLDAPWTSQKIAPLW